MRLAVRVAVAGAYAGVRVGGSGVRVERWVGVDVRAVVAVRVGVAPLGPVADGVALGSAIGGVMVGVIAIGVRGGIEDEIAATTTGSDAARLAATALISSAIGTDGRAGRVADRIVDVADVLRREITQRRRRDLFEDEAYGGFAAEVDIDGLVHAEHEGTRQGLIRPIADLHDEAAHVLIGSAGKPDAEPPLSPVRATSMAPGSVPLTTSSGPQLDERHLDRAPTRLPVPVSAAAGAQITRATRSSALAVLRHACRSASARPLRFADRFPTCTDRPAC